MTPDLIDSLKSAAISLEKISSSTHYWWDTQWFSSLAGAVVGALAALTVGIARDYFSLRRKNLDSWYSHIVKQQQPEHLFIMAGMTIYGGKMTKDGETTVIPEKSSSEKILIEFRKNYKYWNLPMSNLRFLFWRYEKALRRLPNLNSRDIGKTPEYLRAKKIFEKIIKLAERKTGENQWTIRKPH